MSNNDTLPVFTGRSNTPAVPSPAEQHEQLDAYMAKAKALSQMGPNLPKAYQGPGGTGAMILAMDFAERNDIALLDCIRWVSFLYGKPIIETDLAVKLAARDGIRVEVEDIELGVSARARLHGPDGSTYKWWEYNLDMARRAGLLDKDGPWKERPEVMLRHRARKYAIQFDGPMVGMTVIPAEEDDQIADTDTVTPPPAAAGPVEHQDNTAHDNGPTTPETADRLKKGKGPTLGALTKAFDSAGWDNGDLAAWLEEQNLPADLKGSDLAKTAAGADLAKVLADDIAKKADPE